MDHNMAYKPLVLVVGPTGSTGLPIVNALQESGDFVRSPLIGLCIFADNPLLHTNPANCRFNPSLLIDQTRSPILAR